MSVARGAAEVGTALVASVALGFTLEALASAQRFGLHLVPLGPGGGVDPNAGVSRPSPFGEHGWIPVPAAAAAMGSLLWDGTARWRVQESFYGRCSGPLWGQLPTLVGCSFGTLPIILASWLLWMPSECAPLSLSLSLIASGCALSSLFFWLDLFPVLPLARATPAAQAAGVRHSLLALSYVAFYLCVLSDGQCSAVGATFISEPVSFVQALSHEMSGQTPQGAMSAWALAWQVLIACLCVHIVIDYPRPVKEGDLWGGSD